MLAMNHLPKSKAPTKSSYINDFALTSARPDFVQNATLPRHRWYHFKEGFSAGLVQSFVHEYMPMSGGGKMLDPFVGSGTTALEGARLGYHVDGFEINPFMIFMAKVKTRDYTHSKNIEALALQCLKNNKIDSAFTLPNDTTLIERKGLTKWLLNKNVALRFEQIRTAISRLESTRVRELLVLALMSSIVDVANARKDGKCWRYKRNWRQLGFDGSALDNAFAAQMLRFAEDIDACPKLKGRTAITLADARQFADHCNGTDLYDCVLTSPPYLNSFDYTDIYRPELLMLKHACNANELRKLRFATLRSHVQIAWEPSPPLDITLLKQKVREINNKVLWCGRIPEMINAYFVDLDSVIGQCAKLLKVGATAAFVVADSAYSGVVIPVDLVLAEILERRGFTVKKITLFRKTLGNGNHQKRSSERLKEVMVVAKYCKH